MGTKRRRPTHPGTVLYEDVLKPLGMTITEAASKLGISRKTMSELVNAKCALTSDMAVRIAAATNTSPESWYNMQMRLDLWEAEQKKPRIDRFREARVDNGCSCTT
jgi:addiction module HigA family antidote